jgi:BirA family biotin operon repressor/biotin-[acetyl-CoA-carboxylase] ligase
MSVLLRPKVPAATWTLLPLLAGVATAEAVRAVAHLDAVLKWPNDVLVGDAKLGGILVERVDTAAVVGIGVNVSLRADELPVPTATSIALQGGTTDREALTKEIARALARRLGEWEAAGGAPGAILPAYREICATIGAQVDVRLPGGDGIVGEARQVADDGSLVVVAEDGTSHRVAAGDVVHVRRA